MRLENVWLIVRSGSNSAQRQAQQCAEQLRSQGVGVTMASQWPDASILSPVCWPPNQPCPILLWCWGVMAPCSGLPVISPAMGCRSSASMWEEIWVFSPMSASCFGTHPYQPLSAAHASEDGENLWQRLRDDRSAWNGE